MYFTLVLTFLALSTTFAYAKVCPDTPGVLDFDNSRFLGLWYQNSAYQNDLTSGDCVNLDYVKAENGVTNFNVSKITDGTASFVLGSYSQTPEDPAQLQVETDVLEVTITVIEIDYVNYAFGYSCTENDDETITEIGWILTREQYPDEDVQGLISDAIAADGLIDPTLLLYTQNC